MSQLKLSRTSPLATIAYVVIILAVLFLLVVWYKKHTAPDRGSSSGPNFLYVQTAHSGTLSAKQTDGRRILKLNNVSPTTVYFSDRPDRITGHESTAEFIAQWSDGADSFASNPPNAALDVLGGNSQNLAIVELIGARYDAQNETLEYEIIMLDKESGGAFPAVFGEAALFIDSAHVNYRCACDVVSGNTCSCEEPYTLGAKETKEFRAYCLDDMRPEALEISGSKTTSCTPMTPSWSGYYSRSCTNHDATNKDKLNITTLCRRR